MVLLSLLLSLAASVATVIAAEDPRPQGFAYADGENFAVDGEKFYFFGTNAYWFAFLDNITDVSVAMDKAKDAGIKVVRTWGFRDLNTTFVTGGLPQYGNEGAGASVIYFQSWTNGAPTINEGDNGLKRLDQLVSMAEEKGLKLIFALTNNWADYGGMDMYTVNLGGRYHDDFFTLPAIKEAYKNYIKTVVTRLKDSPAVFAWELGNEPRCGADGTRNLPRGPNCNVNIVNAWAEEMSTYIRSLDPHHMIAVGTEGFFNSTQGAIGTSDDWAYNGADGVDSEHLVQLPNVDFGTFHLYPDWWSKTVGWATNFTIAHANLQHKVGKPIISEEYGWLLEESRRAWLGVNSTIGREEAIGAWQEAGLEHKLAADMYWQLGVNGLSFGDSTDDGFTIYLNSPEAQKLIYDHAEKMNRPA